METKLQSKQQYPRFIQNKPCGIDKFDGGSQERLAKTIARHFCQNDSLDEECTLPRIIGIEGIWGSGKSNVVKMLERELSDDYYFFEYDAWGHQEDLQRRSILELLTSKLIDDGILSGNATIKVKGGGTKTVSWSEKLKYLLARKTETVTEKYPLISNGMVAAFLVAVLTPIFTFIAYAVKPTPTTWWFSLLSIIIAALPVLIALCVWKWAYSKDHKYGWSYMLAIYQDKVEKDVCYETLSEDEPTVYEFKTWMQDISDFIKEKGQRKLVLVFDNMDRLPAEKVKELWSSIHTFFADSGFENVWAVIPFDETHLACAFGDETDEQTKQLTHYSKSVLLERLEIDSVACICESDCMVYEQGNSEKRLELEIPVSFRSIRSKGLRQLAVGVHPFVIPDRAYSEELGLLSDRMRSGYRK